MNLSGLNQQEAERFERQTIVAALFRLCDPLAIMEQIKNWRYGSTQVGWAYHDCWWSAAHTAAFNCHWFSGDELKHGLFLAAQLKRVEPEQEWKAKAWIPRKAKGTLKLDVNW